MHICINVSFDEPGAGAVAVTPLPVGHVLLDLPRAHKKILHSRGQHHHHPHHRLHHGKRHGQEQAIDSLGQGQEIDVGQEEEDPLSDSEWMLWGAGRAEEREVEDEEEDEEDEYSGEDSSRDDSRKTL